MRVTVDLKLCESHGQCVLAAPEVFRGFDDESVLQYESEADAVHHLAVERAVAICPAGAIRLEDAGT